MKMNINEELMGYIQLFELFWSQIGWAITKVFLIYSSYLLNLAASAASGEGAVPEHLARQPEVESSSPAAAGTGRE